MALQNMGWEVTLGAKIIQLTFQMYMCTNNYYIHSEILRVQNCFLLTLLLFSLCFGSLVQDKELDTLLEKKKKGKFTAVVLFIVKVSGRGMVYFLIFLMENCCWIFPLDSQGSLWVFIIDFHWKRYLLIRDDCWERLREKITATMETSQKGDLLFCLFSGKLLSVCIAFVHVRLWSRLSCFVNRNFYICWPKDSFLV